jgi:hypothetical protein
VTVKTNIPEILFRASRKIFVFLIPNWIGTVLIPDELSLSTSLISQKIVFIRTRIKMNKYIIIIEIEN